MKTIGLLGGLSWKSSAEYYRIVNEAVAERLGGLHSARCILYSVDFDPIENLQREGEWGQIEQLILDAARSLERAGADFLLLCTNTTHRIADSLAAALRIPLLHIADAVAEQIQSAGLRQVGLLGSRYTMEQDFYKARLASRFGIDVVVPEPGDRQRIDEVIYQELCKGRIRQASRDEFRRIITDLGERGAEGVILGCTEIGLLVKPEDSRMPLFDTTRIHARKAVEMALQD